MNARPNRRFARSKQILLGFRNFRLALHVKWHHNLDTIRSAVGVSHHETIRDPRGREESYPTWGGSYYRPHFCCWVFRYKKTKKKQCEHDRSSVGRCGKIHGLCGGVAAVDEAILSPAFGRGSRCHGGLFTFCFTCVLVGFVFIIDWADRNGMSLTH